MCLETDVLITGAGPVGLTLANALGQMDVRATLVERSGSVGLLPKMDLTNPRSMEIFRRLGLADKIRAAGWPLSARFDVHAAPALDRPPYAVLEYPSILEMQAEIAQCTDGSKPREAYERISQYNLESLLAEEAGKLGNVSVNYGCELLGFTQADDHVLATVRHADGSEQAIRARYLIGCDGGGSTVREQLGIKCAGQFAVGRLFMTFFRAPDLLARSGLRPFRHFMIAGKRHGVLVAQDDLERWALHLALAPDAEIADLDARAEISAALGVDLDPEILHAGAWTPHLIVAEKFRDGRVFLAGDAAHQYIPTGGFGMNTGVSEADNLAWKLAAVLKGWAGEALLDSYEDERRPVALRNCRAAEYAAQGVAMWRSLFRPEFAEAGDPGGNDRKRFAAAINTFQRRSHEQSGIELGYRYTLSRVCVQETGPLPDPDTPTYAPNAAAGSRLPHAWAEPGVSVHDLAGSGLTLLVLDAADAEIARFTLAAQSRDIPFSVVDLRGRPDLARVYERGMLIIRPDLHVAWRHDPLPSAPPDFDRILARCTGKP